MMLEVRDLRFPIERDVPKYWHGGRRSVSIFFDNLSIFFPAGERFFIASLVAYRERITDPELSREVTAFCAQEGIHGREHAKYNDTLTAHGYPFVAMEGRVKRLLRRVGKILSKRQKLAVTCALEHFTAMMAHFVLSDDRILEGADPRMAALWRWHSAEENEHKAVAFDVYRSTGGDEVTRMAIMAGATVIFWAKVLEHQIRMMWADGCLFSLREWWGLFSFLFISPGGLRKQIIPYFDYYRPGFHPWDFDNRDLLDKWREQLTAEGTH